MGNVSVETIFKNQSVNDSGKSDDMESMFIPLTLYFVCLQPPNDHLYPGPRDELFLPFAYA